jgi:uncharacterized protein YodC (DUF2158 family)
MPTSQIKPGDVVTLNSGGPKMTAVEFRTDGVWNVCWFSPQGEFAFNAFGATELRRLTWLDRLGG